MVVSAESPEIADRFAAVLRASESPPKENTRGETGLFITARTFSGVF
jgi:hypothetical protein